MTIYFIRNTRSTAIKIGWSNDPFSRLIDLQVGNEDVLLLETTIPGSKLRETELHERWNRFSIRGEWFTAADEIEEFIKIARAVNLIVNDLGLDKLKALEGLSDCHVNSDWISVWLLQHNQRDAEIQLSSYTKYIINCWLEAPAGI